MRQFLLGAALCALALPLQAQTRAEILECAGIDSTEERLECFDSLAETEGAMDIPPQNWTVRDETSTFTDQVDSYITTRATNGRACRLQNPVLIVRCREGRTSVFINHGCYAPTARNEITLPVLLRWGDSVPETVDLRPSTDDRAFGWWDPFPARDTIRQLLTHDTLAVRFTPYRDPPQDVEFNISNLAAVVRGRGQECGWPSSFARQLEN